MHNVLVSEYLANKICGKKAKFEAGKNLSQSVDTIYGCTSYTEIIHEIAHWIACDPQYRELDNLGLPLEVNTIYDVRVMCKKNTQIKRLYTEEAIALCITKLLFNKYITIYDNKEYDYIHYLSGEACEQMCYFIDEIKNIIEERAYELFIEYTTNILTYEQYKEINNE